MWWEENIPVNIAQTAKKMNTRTIWNAAQGKRWFSLLSREEDSSHHFGAENKLRCSMVQNGLTPLVLIESTSFSEFWNSMRRQGCAIYMTKLLKNAGHNRNNPFLAFACTSPCWSMNLKRSYSKDAESIQERIDALVWWQENRQEAKVAN